MEDSAETLSLDVSQEGEVEFCIGDQTMYIPQAFMSTAQEMDALYTVVLATGLEKVVESALLDAEDAMQDQLQVLQTKHEELQEFVRLLNGKLQQQQEDFATKEAEIERLVKKVTDRDGLAQQVVHLERKLHVSKSVIDRLQAQVIDLREK
jgi:predicted  nucleic acid-binding Zn-ribbon protein